VNSVGGALLVMLPFYIGVGLARQHLTGQLSRRSWVEFAVVGGVALAVTLSYVIQSP
jgi:intracellular septation protein A